MNHQQSNSFQFHQNLKIKKAINKAIKANLNELSKTINANRIE
jgi:hypothetical protein